MLFLNHTRIICCLFGFILAANSFVSADLIDYNDTNSSYYLGNLMEKGIRIGNHTVATCDFDVTDPSLTCDWLGSQRPRCFKWSRIAPSDIIDMMPKGADEKKLGICTCHPVSIEKRVCVCV